MHPVLPAAGNGESAGYSYAGLLTKADRDEVLRVLAELRFSGWLGPWEEGWLVAVPARPVGPVAAAGADLETVGEALARRLDEVVLMASVRRDRALRLRMWAGRRELGRYLSNPAFDAPEDDEAFPDPEGVEHAEDFARACGRPRVAEELTEVLGDVLDEDSEIESERLTRAFRLLGLPVWLVAATALPKDVPGGPRAAECTRLGAGRTGVAGRLLGWVTGVARRCRRRPGRPPRPG